MNDHKLKYLDDGTEISPDLISEPDLCLTCKKDGQPGEEENICNLAGKPIRLRFVLKDADVFAFGFRDKPH